MNVDLQPLIADLKRIEHVAWARTFLRGVPANLPMHKKKAGPDPSVCAFSQSPQTTQFHPTHCAVSPKQ